MVDFHLCQITGEQKTTLLYLADVKFVWLRHQSPQLHHHHTTSFLQIRDTGPPRYTLSENIQGSIEIYELQKLIFDRIDLDPSSPRFARGPRLVRG